MERLIFSSDRDEVARQQGIAQALIAVAGLPETLEGEIVAEQHRLTLRAGFRPEGNGAATEAGPEPY